MTRAQFAAPPLPKGSTAVKIIERSWGIERCYVTPDGEKVCTPAPFLTNHRNLDWTCLALKVLVKNNLITVQIKFGS